jgi:hypothetical protein
MSKFTIVFLTLIFSSVAFAKPVTYVCERPAWEGVKGCGPNNTYYTYDLFVETDDFDKKHPVYDFSMRKGCSTNKGKLLTYKYQVNEEFIEFIFNRKPQGVLKTQMLSVIKLDRKTMKAVLTKVKHGTELTCTEEDGPDRRPGTSPAKDGF